MVVYLISFLAALILAVILYSRTNPSLTGKQKLGLIILRAAAWAMLLAFLITPVIYYIRKYLERPEIVLLRDTSASLQLRHGGKTKSSRLDPAYHKLKSAYKKAGYIIRELVFADGIDGDSKSTNLIPALVRVRELNDKSTFRNVVIFSDGWFRDTDLKMIGDYDLPVIVVADTSSDRVADLQITDFRHNRQGYRNELSLFETGIKADGFRGQARVSFMVDGKAVQEKAVSFSQENLQTVTFEYRFASLGLHRVEARLTAAGLTESGQANNNYTSAIDILSDKDRILLLTDTANWDTKFLLDTIKENNRWEPVSLLVKGDGLYAGDKKVSVSNWESYTCIVITNQGSLQLDSALASSLGGRVSQGCGLLYMGLPVSQLASILPLQQSNVRSVYKGLFQMLPAAGAYPVFQISPDELREIPPVDYYYLASSATAEVLAVLDNAQKSPAIAVSTAAGGKVAAFSFLNLWRWQLRSAEQGYRNFSHDLISWLSSSSKGSLTALYEPSYFLDEPLTIRLQAVDEIRRVQRGLSPRLSLLDEKNETILSDFMLQDGDEYKLGLKLDKPGQYSFRITEPGSSLTTNGRFIVQAQNLESRDLGYNIPLLSWISDQTGGRFLSLGQAQSFFPPKAESSPRIEKRDFPLYKKWYLLTAFILIFCLELYFRRRWGLL